MYLKLLLSVKSFYKFTQNTLYQTVTWSTKCMGLYFEKFSNLGEVAYL